MDRKNFSYTCNAEGYMIQYKGKNIGGTGIIGKYKGRNKTRQINDYKQQAEKTIDELCNNRGYQYMVNKIQEIDCEEVCQRIRNEY